VEVKGLEAVFLALIRMRGARRDVCGRGLFEESERGPEVRFATYGSLSCGRSDDW